MKGAIARELGVKSGQVGAVLSLLDGGNTVPFIARYRKEATGNLDEVQIREVARIAEELQKLEERRAAILSRLQEQGDLTAELKKKIEGADSRARLEDLYGPYKKKRKTRGMKARDAGLEPVARMIEAGEDPGRRAREFTCDAYPTVEDVIAGAQDILAEELADDADLRGVVRDLVRKKGRVTSKKRRGASGDDTYKLYREFSAPVGRIKPHQVLAIRRGDNDKELSFSIEATDERQVEKLLDRRLRGGGRGRRLHKEALEEGFSRLLMPAVERDLWRELEEQAEAHAIEVFAVNLKNLLLRPPVQDRVVLGLDPGLRTGCKAAIVDSTGKLLGTGQCFVHDGRREQAVGLIQGWIDKYGVDLVAIGNGTGSRETEEVVARALKEQAEVSFAVVDEAGASVYSASELARRELPELDVSVRGAVSIARRLQDPLAELVKIDPKSVGVGMYQHDVNQTALREALDAVVEDVVNGVGVDLNAASEALLARVAGVGPALAKRIVDRREEKGAFRARRELLDVSGLGEKTFEQCAGFLRVRGGKEPLDRTAIHPESYGLARKVLREVGLAVGEAGIADGLKQLERSGRLQEIAEAEGVGEHTLADIVDGLTRPGRDPREEFDPPVLRKQVLTMEDLKEGMRLPGTVRNVVDFGAFVDIGVKQDGLVHVSEMADRFVKSAYDEVSVGDRLEVIVLGVDLRRGRIQLSMKAAQ